MELAGLVAYAVQTRNYTLITDTAFRGYQQRANIIPRFAAEAALFAVNLNGLILIARWHHITQSICLEQHDPSTNSSNFGKDPHSEPSTERALAQEGQPEAVGSASA